MTEQWRTLGFRCRNAQIVDRNGEHFVIGEFEMSDLIKLLIPSLLDNPKFVEGIRARIDLRFLEHMTPEEVTRFVSRFQSTDEGGLGS